MGKYQAVIIDNGHGRETKGKRSPIWGDGTQLFEWEFNRDMANRVEKLCNEEGIKCHLIVKEDYDVTLGERCRRANKIYDQYKGKAFLISIHSNAGGGTGFEFYTSRGQTKSDEIATTIYQAYQDEFSKDGWKMRKDFSDGDADKEADFYILKHTKCPAVLAELLFMDTFTDCKFLMSERGKEQIAKAMVEAIKRVM